MEPDLQQKIDLWRSKALMGTLTLGEAREIIVHLRGARIAMTNKEKAKPVRTAKAKPASVNSEQLLGELEDLI